MSLSYEVVAAGGWAKTAARRIGEALPESGSVGLTGGSTARAVYRLLAVSDSDWSGLEVLFSDERCVPPDHPESNFRIADELLLRTCRPRAIHRMRGEDDPEAAASAYHDEIAGTVATGIDLLLLGMGADCHIGAMFPDSPALAEGDRLCAAVDRPDGMSGLTLTPPAILSAKRILLLVTGESKVGAVARVLRSTDEVRSCPARLLAAHGGATFLLDDAAAAEL
ncbi:MAG: 6-phosphogluconolactonase [Actinomycetota bacterium]